MKTTASVHPRFCIRALIGLACFVSATSFAADRTAPVPGKLRIGVPFEIAYNPMVFENDANRPVASLLPSLNLAVYENPFDPPKIFPMEKDNGIWRAVITLNDTTVRMIAYTFQAPSLDDSSESAWKDDNNGLYYSEIVCTRSGIPVQGAHQAMAAFHAGFGGRRPEDLGQSIDDIDDELKNYPENHAARLFRYVLKLRKDDSASTRYAIQKELAARIKNHPNDEGLLRTAAEAYRLIGEADKANETEQSLARLNPRGDQAARNALDEILSVTDPSQKAAGYEQFLEEFPDSRFSELARVGIATSAIEAGDTTRLKTSGEWLFEHGTSPSSANALAGISGALSENQADPVRAEAFIRQALELAKTFGSSNSPPEWTAREWNEQMKTTIARYKDILGWILVQQGRTEEGLPMLSDAAESSHQPGTYIHYAEALKRTGHPEQALVYFARAAEFGGTLSDQARSSFTDLWTALKPNDPDSTAFLDREGTWVKIDFRKRVLAEGVNRSAPDFQLEDLAGGWVRLADQRGDIIVLCFWATWSQSSKSLLRNLIGLAEDYGQEVLFLSVAVDQDRKTIADAARKLRLPFPVLLNQSEDREFGIRGIPTLFVIDGMGKIRFEHKGNRPDIGEILKIELEDLL